MKLTEYEGKQLLSNAGLVVSQGTLINVDELDKNTKNGFNADLEFPIFAKAQVTYGNRALNGLVKKANSPAELSNFFTICREQQITKVALEPLITYQHSVYVGVRYDTRFRSLIVEFSELGGAGMDERGDSIVKEFIPLTGQIKLSKISMPGISTTVTKMRDCLLQNDAVLVEVNPLVYAKNDWICLDAKIELENQAAFRHPEWEQYGQRSDMGRSLTERELQARQVSASDHRGVAGESFFEFPGGTIGVMASGGGASTLAMDALMAAGLKPANYTEYSGNPTREKVASLADVVLSIPNLKALYVVGSNANFTDIYETLAGVVDGLERSPYQGNDFVILIRRGGPRWKEAFEMVEQRLAGKGYILKMFGPEYPLVQTATELAHVLKAH